MRYSTLQLAVAVGTFICFTTAGAATAAAQNRTIVTTSGPVRLPGLVLEAGRYNFQTLSSTAGVIRISRMDGNPFTAFVRAIPTTRPQYGSVISLRSGIVGSVPEMATWYADGGTSGYMFDQLVAQETLSAKDLAALDQRLVAATGAVNDARRQLQSAETDRDAIRTERARAK